MLKESNKPQVRFKGFDDAWEERKVFEIADRYDNLRIPVAANLRIAGNTPYYGANGIQDYVDGFTHDGEFVLVAEDGANNLKNYPVRYVEGRIWVNNHAHVLQGKEKIADNLFLSYGLGRADIESLLVGGGRAKLNAEIMMGIDIRLPGYPEQAKMGVYFNNLDKLITLQQQKYDKLVNVKKAMLEKMFLKDGADVPEIRFKGFTAPWEQRKLGELVEFYNGDRSSRYPSDSDMVSDGVPFINAGDLVSGRVKLDTANKITEEKFNELSGAKIQRGDIIYCLRGTLGKNAFVDNFDVGTVASSLVDIRPKNILGKYLFQVLNSDIEYRQRTVNDEGAAQPNLSAKNLSLFNIPMPKEAEQEKIAAYFDSLDHLITLHQRKLEKLQNIKKACLEKMFV